MTVYQRVCPKCGETFTTTEYQRKYCSPECSSRVGRRTEYYSTYYQTVLKDRRRARKLAGV